MNKAKREKQAAQRRSRERMWLEQEAERDWLAQRELVASCLRQREGEADTKVVWIPETSQIDSWLTLQYGSRY